MNLGCWCYLSIDVNLVAGPQRDNGFFRVFPEPHRTAQPLTLSATDTHVDLQHLRAEHRRRLVGIVPQKRHRRRDQRADGRPRSAHSLPGRADLQLRAYALARDFEALGEYLGDPVITTSLVDRMVHHAIIVNITGPSYRMHESKELNRSADGNE